MRPSEERPGYPADPGGPSTGGGRLRSRARGPRVDRGDPTGRRKEPATNGPSTARSAPPPTRRPRSRNDALTRWTRVIAVAGPVLTVAALATLSAWLVGELRRVAVRSIASLSAPDTGASGRGETSAAAFRPLATALGEWSSVDGALGPLVGALLALVGCWAVALGTAHVTARLLARFLARR